MKRLSISLILLLALGCNTQRRAINQLERLQDKHPALFSSDTVVVNEIKTDTLTVIEPVFVPEEKIDTAVVTSLTEIIEDLSIENSRLRVQLKTTANIETNSRTWELSGTCKDDTIYQELVRLVNYHHYKVMKPAACEVVKGAPWWYYLISAVLGALLTFLSLKGRSTGELIRGLIKGV